MQPRFSQDYSRLCYIASEEKFLTHSGNYQLKYIHWNKYNENYLQHLEEEDGRQESQEEERGSDKP